MYRYAISCLRSERLVHAVTDRGVCLGHTVDDDIFRLLEALLLYPQNYAQARKFCRFAGRSHGLYEENITEEYMVDAPWWAIMVLGLLGFARHILREHPELVNKADSHGWTPPMVAVWGSYERYVDLLLDAGANIHQPAPYGTWALFPQLHVSPMMLAIERSRGRTLDTMLQRSEWSTSHLPSLLHAYIRMEDKQNARRLIKYMHARCPSQGNDFGGYSESNIYRLDGASLLHAAIEIDSHTVVQALLDAGHAISPTAYLGKSVLQMSIEMGCSQITQYLLQQGVDPTNIHPNRCHTMWRLYRLTYILRCRPHEDNLLYLPLYRGHVWHYFPGI